LTAEVKQNYCCRRSVHVTVYLKRTDNRDDQPEVCLTKLSGFQLTAVGLSRAESLMYGCPAYFHASFMRMKVRRVMAEAASIAAAAAAAV
jgi:hypothetical protein